MKIVRRARKSIRERRMKACQNDLNSNLAKVEMRVFRKQKSDRTERRRVTGGMIDRVPADVRLGRMNMELYQIECRLHKEAGIPAPFLPVGMPLTHASPSVARNASGVRQRMIGFISFHELMRVVSTSAAAESAAPIRV